MRPARDPQRINDEAEAAAAMEDFLKRGGQITEIPSGKQDMKEPPFTIVSEKKKWNGSAR